MKILIIGGSRFVGPYVVDLLVKHKHSITVFNRGLIQDTYKPDVRYIKGDRNKGFNINEKFDVVIDTCSYGGEQSLKVVNELNFGYLLNFSSVAVYKDPVTLPIYEDYPILNKVVMGNYASGKAEVERVLLNSKTKYSNIRPTYILGPKNYCDRENFIYSRLLSNKPILIPGNGEAVVQFVFAEEVAESMVLLAENKLEGNFNCVGNEYITLNNLVRSMAKIARVKAIIKHNPNTDGNNFDENEFPFANESCIYSNNRIKSLGINFKPLLDCLERDYTNYYQRVLSR